MRMGDWSDAESYLQEAFEKDAKNPDTLANLLTVGLHLSKPVSRHREYAPMEEQVTTCMMASSPHVSCPVPDAGVLCAAPYRMWRRTMWQSSNSQTCRQHSTGLQRRLRLLDQGAHAECTSCGCAISVWKLNRVCM